MNVTFQDDEFGKDFDWRTTPIAAVPVLLDGEVEIEVSGGLMCGVVGESPSLYTRLRSPPAR